MVPENKMGRSNVGEIKYLLTCSYRRLSLFTVPYQHHKLSKSATIERGLTHKVGSKNDLKAPPLISRKHTNCKDENEWKQVIIQPIYITKMLFEFSHDT